MNYGALKQQQTTHSNPNVAFMQYQGLCDVPVFMTFTRKLHTNPIKFVQIILDYVAIIQSFDFHWDLAIRSDRLSVPLRLHIRKIQQQ